MGLTTDDTAKEKISEFETRQQELSKLKVERNREKRMTRTK